MEQVVNIKLIPACSLSLVYYVEFYAQLIRVAHGGLYIHSMNAYLCVHSHSLQYSIRVTG